MKNGTNPQSRQVYRFLLQGSQGERTAGPVEQQLAGQRILVVEDNFLIADEVCDALRSCGCIVVGPAAGLQSAMDLARDAAIDAALLDINLKGERCFAVADLLRERNVPFVFLSGYDDILMVPDHLRSEVRVCKPVDEDMLLAVVCRLVMVES